MTRRAAPVERRLWKRRAPHATDALKIPRRPPGVTIPLALGQQPIWLAECFEAGSTTYNAFEALRIRGPLDTRRLQRALDSCVRRHEILRTAFRTVAGEGVQVVSDTGSFVLDVEVRPDLELGTDAFDDRCRAFVRAPFDFARGVLARACFIRIAPDDGVLLLAMHHIVRDGASMGILLAELGAAYADGPEPPALPIQFGDYACWQRDLAASGAFDEQLTFWREHLRDAPLVLNIPADRRRIPDSTAGSQRSIELPHAILARLRKIAADADATLFMTLAAAFATFMHRYTGVSDLLTGFPVAGRLVPETSALIGCFINTVVLRTKLAPDDTFATMLARVRENALAAYDNQDVPFAHVVEALNPERRAGESPVIQTMVTLVDPRRPKLQLPDMTVEPYPVVPEISKLDLSLELLEHADGLTARFEYRSDLFDATTVSAMLAHFATLVEGVADDPDAPLATLPLVSCLQSAQLDDMLSGPARPVSTATIDHRIAQQARRSPESVAVVCGDERLTYAELDAAANALAYRLRSAGVTRESRVAIMSEPTAGTIVAVLGILKAGAAYVPIDARYPDDRVRAVIADASPTIALADARSVPRLRAHVPTIAIDALLRDARVPDAFETVHEADGLAYVIYTSGTTGVPKGVAVEHRSVVAYVDAVIEHYRLTASDVVLQFTSLSFDTSAQDIFATLAAGATLAIATPEMRISPTDLLLGCGRFGVTVFDLPTAYWRLLVDELEAGRAQLPRTLRLAVVGGEALSPNSVKSWIACTNVRLVNAYGPTEATISATMHDVTAGDLLQETIPVGKPLPNRYARILDDAFSPVPRGSVGELFLGGAGLARGYYDRPALTERAFIADPHRPGARLYSTGDLARIDGAGELHVLGRRDGQVKIRGFRVELGEIEAVVAAAPGVRTCAVVVREHAGEKRLVAHVVPAAGCAFDADRLDAALRGTLPEYMIPVLSPIDALPLSVTGKVDRAALPAPRMGASARPASDGARTELERSLVEVWEDLLERRPIGIRDNFFAIGGHSLLAIRMAHRLEQLLGRPFPIRWLFHAQTIEAIAQMVTDGAIIKNDLVTQVRSGSRRVPLVFLHGDYNGGGSYCARLAEGLDAEQPLFIVRPHDVADGVAVPSIEAMAEERLRALRALQPRGPYAIAGYCINGTVAIEMARRARAAGEDVPLVVLIDAPLGLLELRGLRPAVRVLAGLLRWSPERRLRAFARLHRNILNFRWYTLPQKLRVLCARRPSDIDAALAGELDQGYVEAIERYAPQPYDGRVVMINSRIDRKPSEAAPIDWRAVVSDAELILVPSTHRRLVQEHAGEIGRRMQSALDAGVMPNSFGEGAGANVDTEAPLQATLSAYRAG